MMRTEYSHTIDIRDFDKICFTATSERVQTVVFEVTLYPLKIGRPEFYPWTRASVLARVQGETRVQVSVKQFDVKQMADAGFRYISAIEIRGKSRGSGEEADIRLSGPEFLHKGSLAVRVDRDSRAGEAGETLRYRLEMQNESDRERAVTVTQMFYGRESMICRIGGETADGSAALWHCMLPGGGRLEVPVEVLIHDNIPPGGMEMQRLLICAQGEEDAGQQATLYTARRRPHPYLMHTEEGFRALRGKIGERPWAEQFEREILNPAKEWQAPEPAGGKADYVYPAYSQKQLGQCVVAYKLTGEREYGEKAAAYLRGLCDRERGYLSTRHSYFKFIEDLSEYASGDFKVHRACSAGWVQEAEFFIQTAVAYDILYDSGLLTKEDHAAMEEVFHSYMEFQDWLLTDGDGNNFQLAEAASGMMCAMALQEEGAVRRFLYGKNGLTDLLSSVLLNDGMYFEMATGYLKLAGEILMDAAVACENYGIPFKYFQVQGCYDEKVLLSPWANREKWAEDGKPFLGMSFSRFQNNTNPRRSLKMYFDALIHFVTEDGVLFSSNDSNEHSCSELFDRAYYLYRDERYLKAVQDGQRNLLYGVGPLRMGQAEKAEEASKRLSVAEKEEEASRAARKEPGSAAGGGEGENLSARAAENQSGSYLAKGAGYAILRRKSGGRQIQAVVKYGQHGGYHGHFDRISLLSVICDNQSFYNTEYAWFGYDSFLFKMWVQTSMAHNMVVVDGRMQEAAQGECILYTDREDCRAVCVQNVSRWCDPPYGGQTPYPAKFPEEKCSREGRYILMPERPRGQGEIGEYSEPVFSRRLVILAEHALVVLDYLKAEQTHTFDCLYHPMGAHRVYGPDREEHPASCIGAETEGSARYALSGPAGAGRELEIAGRRMRFDRDPFGAGQFITNCECYRPESGALVDFVYTPEERTPRQAIPYVGRSRLFCVSPAGAEIIVGKYPQSEDCFSEEEIRTQGPCRDKNCKKTVSVRQTGREARFVTALEVLPEGAPWVAAVRCGDFRHVEIVYADKTSERYVVDGMDKKDGPVTVSRE